MLSRFVRLAVAVAVWGFLVPSWLRADEPKGGAGPKSEEVEVEVVVVGAKDGAGGGLVFQLADVPQYWLGVALEVEDGKLEVGQVLPGSPADKAGLKAEDVLLAGGDAPLKAAEDLQKLVQNSGGKPLALKVARGGKELTVQVTPERRAAGPQIVIGQEQEGAKGEADKMRLQLKQLAEQLQKQAETQRPAPGRWVPGTGLQVLNVPSAAIPDNLEVTLKKKGNNPLRIKVRQGAQTWSVSEKELDKLPEPIRGHVARMLPGHAAATFRAMPGAPLNPAPQAWLMPGQPRAGGPLPGIGALPPGAGLPPGAPLPGAPAPGAANPPMLMPRTNPPVPAAGGELQQEVNRLKQQVHELREQLDALRKK
jgi:hypothetical protein